jgi:hypothetical protein
MPHSITNAALYLEDFAAWCAQTAAAIRAGQWDAIDLEALAEEVESLGKRETRELESRLEVLVMHLLKWEHQPGRREEGHSWFDTIIEQRSALARLVRDNPSFRPRLPQVLSDIYPTARRRAMGDMALGMPLIDARAGSHQTSLPPVRLPPPMLPLACPWSITEVLENDFWPGPFPPVLP